MGSHRCRKRNTTELRRKCDRCDLRFYSHFCLLIHLKIHLRSGWFRCSICSKPFKTLARFLKHGKHHIARIKPKRLCKTSARTAEKVTKAIDSVTDEEMPSQVMGTSFEGQVPHISPNKPEKFDEGEIAKLGKDNQEVEGDYGITSDDKLLKAMKFVEQLKSLLKLDDQEQIGMTQDEPDPSHSLQVLEVTSSSMNGVPDSSSGAESEAQIERLEEDKDDIGLDSKIKTDQAVSLEVNSVSKIGKTDTDKESISFHQGQTKGSCSAESGSNKKTRIIEPNKTVVGLSKAKSKVPMTIERSSLPTAKFSCSICRSRFFSYSQLKRHKRVIHKLYSKAESSYKLQSYHCTLCFQQLDTIRNLNEHMRTAHNVTHKFPKLWMKSSKSKISEALDFSKDGAIDVGADCIDIKPGHLECSLCGTGFLTYKGHREHLKRKHNASVFESNGSKQNIHVKNNSTKKHARQGSVKGYSPCNGADAEKVGCSQDCGNGYDSDTSARCKKCESVFASVKERREHELKSHGLKVHFEGEQALFIQMDTKKTAIGEAEGSSTSRQKAPIIDSEERFFNRLKISCKLCSRNYLLFNSLQKHMMIKHNVRAYKVPRNAYRAAKAQEGLPTIINSVNSFPGGTVKGIKSRVCSFTSKGGKILQKRKLKSPILSKLKTDGSKIEVPLSVSNLPGKQLEAISKKMGTSPSNLLVYRLEGVEGKLKGSPNNIGDQAGKTKLFIVKVKPPTGKQGHGLARPSVMNETLTMDKRLDSFDKRLPESARSLSYKRMSSNNKAILSIKNGSPSNKRGTVSLKEKATSNKELLLSHANITPLGNGVISLGQAEKFFEKSVGDTSILPIRENIVSEMVDGNIRREEQTHDKSSGIPPETSNPVADGKEIDHFLWHTDFSKKRYSCLVCDVSFSGFNIQRKHMLTYHDIHLDVHGNRVIPTPTKETAPKRVDDDSLKVTTNGQGLPPDSPTNNITLLPLSSHEEAGKIGTDEDFLQSLDDSEPSMLYGYNSSMEECYDTKTLEDGTEVYLCSHCPLHFKSLVDRLIHINDIHKGSTPPLHHDNAASQASTLLTGNDASPSKSSLPELNAVSQSLPNHVASVKTAKEKSFQGQGNLMVKKKKKRDPPGIYRCHICSKFYKYYRGIYRHIKMFHKKKPPSRADLSAKDSSSAKVLSENIRCHLCNRKFRAFNHVITHLKRDHSKKVENVNTELPTLNFAKGNVEVGMEKVREDSLTHKNGREMETISSNLLASKMPKKKLKIGQTKSAGSNLLVKKTSKDKSLGKKNRQINSVKSKLLAAKVPEDTSTYKKNRQIETVRSNLLAISIRDEPSLYDDDCIGDTHAQVDAQLEQDSGYVPVPPCDDESEFASEDVEVVEDNVFSRLQANLLGSSPQLSVRDEPTSLDNSAITDGYSGDGRSDRNDGSEKSGELKEKNSDGCYVEMNEAPAAYFSLGKISNGQEKSRNREALQSKDRDRDKDILVKNVQKKHTPVKHIPKEYNAGKHNLTKNNPKNHTPVKNFVKKSNVVKHIPEKHSPVKHSPVKQIPIKHTPEKQIPNNHNPLSNSDTQNLRKDLSDDDQVFACTIPGCGKTFNSKTSYDLHVLDTCFLCHKRYSSSYNVLRHVREVHKIVNMLPCDLCGREFPEPISLASHNRIEHLTPEMYASL